MKPYYEDDLVTLYHGDALECAQSLPDAYVQTIVTSPPYFGLRDYGVDGQMGAESSLDEYVSGMVGLFRELRRALSDDGTLWLNIGDSYAGSGASDGVSTTLVGRPNSVSSAGVLKRKPGVAKNLLGVPWRVAFALQADGWILRSDIIWAKPNPMPESVTDRPTRSHEYLFLLTKRPRYFYDAAAIAEPLAPASRARVAQATPVVFGGEERGDGGPGDKFRTRSGGTYKGGETANKRTVWPVATVPFSEAHFAAYPPELIRPCILAGSRPGDVVLDPFSGSGTTGMVATQEGRKYIGFDLNADYLDMSLRTRFAQPVLNFGGAA